MGAPRSDGSSHLAKILAKSSAGSMVSFGVVSGSGQSTDYGFVGIRIVEIASWQIDPLLDAGPSAALWAELQTFTDDDAEPT